jgi:hypothetical protein
MNYILMDKRLEKSNLYTRRLFKAEKIALTVNI